MFYVIHSTLNGIIPTSTVKNQRLMEGIFEISKQGKLNSVDKIAIHV